MSESEQRNPQTITKKLKYEKEKIDKKGTYAIFKTLFRVGGRAGGGRNTFIAQKMPVSTPRQEAGTAHRKVHVYVTQ